MCASCVLSMLTDVLIGGFNINTNMTPEQVEFTVVIIIFVVAFLLASFFPIIGRLK